VALPGLEAVDGPTAIGREYAGVVEQAGSEVRNIRPGDFSSGNSCRICQRRLPVYGCRCRTPWVAPSLARDINAHVDGRLLPCGA
jgi:Zn-dependent alcohol dehydrogenase